MKQNSTKTFAELLWDHDDIRMCIPKSLRYEDVYPSFNFKPLIMPGLTPGLQAQLSNLEYELKQFYLLTAILKKFSIDVFYSITRNSILFTFSNSNNSY